VWKENHVNGLDDIIAQLEHQRTAIDQALEALRGVAQKTISAKPLGRPKSAKKATKKRVVSDEGRQRQIEAMRRYWATKKKAAKQAARK
jgi:hypothetical protein